MDMRMRMPMPVPMPMPMSMSMHTWACMHRSRCMHIIVQVIDSLLALARDNRTIVCTIHSPSAVSICPPAHTTRCTTHISHDGHDVHCKQCTHTCTMHTVHTRCVHAHAQVSFSKFDDLLMLKGGQSVYSGPVSPALDYFVKATGQVMYMYSSTQCTHACNLAGVHMYIQRGSWADA